jgi:hypothetical protein
MNDASLAGDDVAADIWTWMREFVAVKNDFYGGKFPPCPFALRALVGQTVDVAAWTAGDIKVFIRQQATDMSASHKLTTRVMAFPPRTQFAWGISEFVESLNVELIRHNIFLNTGVAKTTVSRYAGSLGKPYFIVVANSLDAVLRGAEALQRTDYYEEWPTSHFQIVVGRRDRMAKRYGAAGEPENL